MEQILEENTLMVYSVVVAISYITGCVQVYGLCLFKKHDSLVIIQRRYPKIVMMESMMCCIALFVSLPIDYNTAMDAFSFSRSEYNQIITFCGIVISSYSPFFMLVAEGTRIWLISYDLHYLSSSKNSKWKSQIDASFADKDWYLRNLSTWGNRQFVGKYCFIYYILASTSKTIMHTVIEAVDRDYLLIYHFTNFLFCVTPTFTVFYVYFKTPKRLNDEFLFQYELKWTTILWGVGFICYVSAIAVDSMGYHRMSYTMTSLITIGSLYSPALLSTVVVPTKIIAMKSWDAASPTFYRSTRIKHSEKTKKQREMAPVDYVLKLRETLDDEAKFEAFIEWMYREFSSENILSFIELVQFKQWIKDELRRTGSLSDSVETVNTQSDQYDYKLYDKMPKSSIIYEINCGEEEGAEESIVETPVAPAIVISETVSLSANEGETGKHIVLEVPELEDVDTRSRNVQMRARKIAHLFYKKYIKTGSVMEINISGLLREKFKQLDRSRYADLEMVQFITLYDELIGEMMKYISYSFVRFDISLQ